MIANERIKAIRLHRRLSSKGLADLAGISLPEMSLIERQMRSPRTDTLQKLAAALEVTTSYLLGEVHSELLLATALARESLILFIREEKPTREQQRLLHEISRRDSAPDTVKGTSYDE